MFCSAKYAALKMLKPMGGVKRVGGSGMKGLMVTFGS